MKQMLERGKLNNGEQIDYASGLSIGTYRGLNTVDHGGADAGYRADLIRFPDQHFSAACLCNLSTANPSDLTRKVADIYLAKEMKPAEAARADDSKPVELTAEQMKARVGTYGNVKDEDDFVRWVIKDGKLQVGNVGDDDTYPVKVLSETQFHLLVSPVDFTFLPAKVGAPLSFTLKQEDGKIETFAAIPPFAPLPAQLTDYAGAYSSPEIDPIYELKVENVHVAGWDPPEPDQPRLVLHRLKSDPDPLRPVARDFFASSVGRIRFTRNAKGEVDGFLLNTGRVVNLRFIKGRPAIAAK